MKLETSLKTFRFIAWFASIYHISLGLLATFGTAAFVIPLANKVYGITITIDPDLFMVLARFAGSYMIAFGLMMGLLARRPLEYHKIAWIGIILILVRIFDRVVFYSALQKTLGVTLQSSIPTLIVIGLMAAGLFFLMPKQRS